MEWVPELRLAGSSSYDCNVYLWGQGENGFVRKGSLVLGNKATAPGQEPDPETAKYRRQWKITENVLRLKKEQQQKEFNEAIEMWEEVSDTLLPSYNEDRRQKEHEARKKQNIDEHRTQAKAQLALGNQRQAKRVEDMDEDEKEQQDNNML